MSNTNRRMNQLLRNDQLAARGEDPEPVPEKEEPLGLPSEWPKAGFLGSAHADAGAGTRGRRYPVQTSMNDILRGWLEERVKR